MPKRLKYKYHQNDAFPSLPSDFILVFGSNERGLHRAGVGPIAVSCFGAELGVFAGISGRSYAIPVKDRFIRDLYVDQIKKYVDMFKDLQHNQPDLRFWITDVCTEGRQYKPYTIAPLFIGCNRNCSFPVGWKRILK